MLRHFGILGSRARSHARRVMSAKGNVHHTQSGARVAQTSKVRPCTPNPYDILSTFTRPFSHQMPSRKKQKRGKRQHLESSHLDAFFANYYPQFKYDTTESASYEFYRLCNESGWDDDNPERKQAHIDFKDALVRQFNQVYGTDQNDLGDWQNLCYIVHIEPIPENLNACREAVRGTHVNLVDLVDTDTTGEEVQVFKSERALSKYTISTGKFFPRENAYAGGLLRYLLRHILCPATQDRSHRRTKKRR